MIFSKNATDDFVTLQLATEFLNRLSGTLKNLEFSTNGNFFCKMCVDLPKAF